MTFDRNPNLSLSLLCFPGVHHLAHNHTTRSDDTTSTATAPMATTHVSHGCCHFVVRGGNSTSRLTLSYCCGVAWPQFAAAPHHRRLGHGAGRVDELSLFLRRNTWLVFVEGCWVDAGELFSVNSRVSSRPRPCTISQQGRAGWPRLPRPAAAPPPPTFLGTRSSDDAAVAENSTPRSAESQAERGSRIEAILAARALRAGRGAVAEERGGGEDRGAWSRGDGLGCCHDFERCVDEACWAGSGVLD
ncbi:hypothetical protein HDK77DRAFT_84685 [Phyllosticta capitalensis]|uniref:Uncharacterized protein n=1 Tax=Phyllosticta capitalensis TaxID=121624 RepID=A0ABR1YF37_9PEZI